jgi:hypothetical protein
MVSVPVETNDNALSTYIYVRTNRKCGAAKLTEAAARPNPPIIPGSPLSPWRSGTFLAPSIEAR